MRIEATPLAGAYLLHQERHADERGWFSRTLCVDELLAAGLHGDFPQHNASWNARAGTLRGLHAQAPPHEEVKVVRVVRGRIFDAVVDLREGSPSRGRSWGLELDADGGVALYIPAGFLHGFLTLEDNTEVHYAMGMRYVASAAVGYRWDDPTFAIAWPSQPRLLSVRDANLPYFEPYLEDGPGPSSGGVGP